MSFLINPFRFSAAAAFVPTDLANLVNWFDATDAATITETAGEVSAWENKGSGGNLAEAVGARQPNTATVSGVDSLFFDGGDALFLAGTSQTTEPHTVFGLIAPTNSTGTGYVWYQDAPGPNVLQSNTDILTQHPATAGDPAEQTAASVLSAGGLTAFIVRNEDNTTGVIETDDGTTGSDATVGTLVASITRIIIGARTTTALTGFNGHIVHVGSYSQRLSDGDKDDLMDYLQTVGGL